MKKTLTSLISIVLISNFVAAQSIAKKFAKEEIQALPTFEGQSETDIYKTKRKLNTKAYLDTAFYEDFDSTTFISNGWTITNNNANNAVWLNTGVFVPGQFSSGAPAIKSTTASNGFMLLNGDLINTPIPPTGAITMDTWFTSDTIWLTGSKVQMTAINPNSVWVRFQHYLRYCCSSANELVLEVSTNDTTWVTFDATNGLPVSASNSNFTNAVSLNEINITTAVCGAPYIFVRFRSTDNSHYFWMIDDFAVLEGPEHDLVLSQEYMQFNIENYAINPFYHQIPYAFFPTLAFSADVRNNGSAVQSNVSFDVTVDHTFDTAGNPGIGQVYSTSTSIDTLKTICDTADLSSVTFLTDTPGFSPDLLGTYQINYTIDYDSAALEQRPFDNSDSVAINVVDSVFARDDGGLSGGVGAHLYVANGSPGGTAAGDRIGLLYVVEWNNKKCPGVHVPTRTVPTSISYFVNRNTANIGVEIVPKIWAFDEDSATIGQAFVAEVASSFIPYVVQSTDTNSLLTLQLDAGTALINGMDSGQYVVGWEVTSIAGNTSFEVWNDASTAAQQPNVSCFLDFGHAPGWGWIDVNPAIRLNFDSLSAGCLVGQEEIASNSTTKFYVGPNPNQGIFELRIQNQEMTSYQLNVRNTLGQSIYQELVYANGQEIKSMDLSGVEKGIYIVSLENERERFVEKVVIK